jgi:hypothetical protein
VNPHLAFLLSDIYREATLHPEHDADLAKSGITSETVATQRIRTVMPPAIFDDLLGFQVPAAVTSMLLFPFFSITGALTDHVRVKVFPSIETPRGTIKYLQPKRSGVRIYFPLAALDQVLHSDAPLYIVEGEKKALAVAQTGLAALGICGVEGWHVGGALDLHPDLDDVGLRGRVVNVIPDADVRTNPAVQAAVRRLATALSARGAIAKLVRVPAGFKGIDDWLAEKA